jgi:spermidine/putrescine-binding protein
LISKQWKRRHDLRLVPEAIRSNPVIFPDDGTQQRLQFTADLGEDAEDLYEDAWDREVGD